MKHKKPFIVYCLIFFFCNVCSSYAESCFDLFINHNTEKPPPPFNDVCSGATELGLLDCGFDSTQFFEDPEATPDPEATGNCVGPLDLGQWYKFTTPNPLPYASILWNGSWTNVEIFTSATGCNDLEYVDCFTGISYFEPEPGTTYYILSTGGFVLSTYTLNGSNECDSEVIGLDFYSPPLSLPFTTECNTPSDIVLCENDQVVWSAYTIYCWNTSLDIFLTEYTGIGHANASEVSISVFADDCQTLLSDNDVNGLGYVCSGVGNNEVLSLVGLEPGTVINIALGSNIENIGFFQFHLEVTSAEDISENDVCSNSILLSDGANIELDNTCSTNTGLPSDNFNIACPTQDEATVWYEYDPGAIPVDITIDLEQLSILSPSIVVFDGCLGDNLGSNCDNSPLELTCINSPILIMVGSTLDATGEFNIEITTIPSLGSDTPIIMADDICSGEEIDMMLEMQSGSFFDINIDIHLTSSPLITGMNTHFFADASSITINDELVNTSSTIQEAIYTVSFSSSTGDCPPVPFEFSIFVYPDFLVNNITVEECMPFELELDIDDLITQGTPPYNSIEWYWNGIDLLGSGESLTTNLTESGEIIVNVIDSEGCTTSATIYINELQIIEPTFDILLEYCQTAQDNISFPTTSLEGISGTWNPSIIDFTQITTTTNIVVTFTPDEASCSEPFMETILVNIGITPEFLLPNEFCADVGFFEFPTTDLNGVIGDWLVPSIDFPTNVGTQYNTFMASSPGCFADFIYEYEVLPLVSPEFFLPNEFCSEEEFFEFPTTDLNGIAGYWLIPFIDLSTAVGTQYNTFIASSPGCFADFNYEFEVLSSIPLEFDFPESICKNDPSLTLDNVSLQGYEGTWDISVIDPSSTNGDYIITTWTPLSGQSPCLSDTTVTILITEPFSPSFDLPEELCGTDSIFTFPSEDLESITGTWSVSMIDPSNETETITSEFTPDNNCANVFSWEIEIIEPIIPFFDIDTLYCSLDSIFILPTESDNGIQGEWSMPMINPASFVGEELIVQFSGTIAGECVESTEIVINIQEALDPEFDLLDKLCWSEENLLLPTTSLNGVSGVWEPSTIDILSNIGQSINVVFMPESGSCFRSFDKEIEIVAPYDVTPITSDPSDCDTEDGMISLDIQSGSNLEFSIDDGTSWQSSNIFGTLGSGGYIILVRSTDNETCELNLEAYLNASDGPIINEVSSTDVNDCMNANGIITIDAQGVNLEYSLDGINWQTNNVFDNLPEGSYEIEIREALSDCIITASAEIIDFPLTNISIVNPINLSDCNVLDGSIEIIAEGQALEYSIDNGITWSASNIFSNLDAGSYQIIVRSTEGINCEATDVAILTAPSMPTILNVSTEVPTTCFPSMGSILVDADGNDLEFSIDGGSTWQDSNLFSELLSDDYQLIIRNKENINCFEETTVTINIEFDQLEESTLQATMQTDCDLEDGRIEILDNNPELEYSIDNGSTWQVNTIFENLASGNYVIISRKITIPDCKVEQSVEIFPLDCPCKELIIEVSTDSLSCTGTGSVELTSIIGMSEPGVEIRWQDGTQGAIKDELDEGWQFYTIKYDENCEWTDSIYIGQLEAIEFNLNTQDLECADSNNGTIEIIDETGGNGAYMYSLDGITYQEDPIFVGLASDIYEVFVFDGDDCVTTEEIEILTQPGINISLPNVDTILLGETVIINPIIDIILIDSFSWTPTIGILNPDELMVTITPTETTTYSLEVYYGNCFAHNEITIEVLELEEEEEEDEEEEDEENEEDIYIGNIFSPNGDNLNDILNIQGSENITLEGFRIYDRWGNLIFNQTEPEINNAQAGWDGYYQGARVVPGVYVYTIDYTKNGVLEMKIGAVTLIW